MSASLTWADVLAEPAVFRSPHWMSAAWGRWSLAGRRAWPEDRVEGPIAERVQPVVEARPLSGAWPDADAVGSRAPALVLVGERAPRGQPAFLSRSGHWLLRGLRAAGWDELRVVATNAVSPDARRRTDVLAALAAHLAPCAPVWVALGTVAGRVLRAARIAHVVVRHPASHARFAALDGPEGWAREVLVGGLPAGPWIGRALPVVPHADARTRLAEVLGVPHDVAYRPAPRAEGTPGARSNGRRRNGAARSAGPHVAPAKREEARRLFVSGEVETVGEAATRAGASAEDVRAVARAEGWHAQREAQLRGTTDRSLAEAMRLDARRFAQAREESMGLALEMLKNVAQRMEKGQYVPRAGEATDMARLAIAFQGATAPEMPADDELARLPPRELAARILALPIMQGEEK